MRSSAPGAKFSTSTSHSSTSRVSTSLPVSSFEFSSMERLLWLSIVKYRLSASGTSIELLAGGVADARALDLDDVGAEPGEQLGAGRSGLHVGEVEDLDPL